jgi:hypothetical protein
MRDLRGSGLRVGPVIRPHKEAVMDDTLRSLLRELERFGAVNDARASQREEKMLNITPETGSCSRSSSRRQKPGAS